MYVPFVAVQDKTINLDPISQNVVDEKTDFTDSIHVTLSLDLKEAAILSSVLGHGRISLVLRSTLSEEQVGKLPSNS